MAYLGNNLTVQQYAPQIAYFNGNGSQTAFTLPVAVVSAAQIIVAIENVIQNPSSAFSVSGTTITFTSAPPSGTNNIWVEYTSLQTNIVQPANASVTPASLSVPNALYWDANANVGIGTTSPQSKLDVSGIITSSSSGKYLNAGWSGSNAYIQTTDASSNGYSLIFYGGASERMRISSGGNVGIGTATPAQQLDVSSTVEGIIAVTSTGTNGKQYNLISTGGASGLGQGAFSIYDRTVALSRILVDTNGKVLVNATAQSAGNARFYVQTSSEDLYLGVNGVTKNFAVAASGQIYSQFTSITSLSDVRTKENIAPVQYGLKEVIGLNPVTFNFIDHPDNITFGFIAQEVEPLLPELVDDEKDRKAEDGTPYKTLKMGDMLPILVKAIQEQQAIIEDLKARIEILEAK